MTETYRCLFCGGIEKYTCNCEEDQWVSLHPTEVIATAITTIQSRDQDQGLDVIFDYVHSAMRFGRSNQVEDLFSNISVDTYPLVLLIGLLTATYSWKRVLPGRQIFFNLVQDRIRAESPQREHELLDGLN